MSNSVDPDQTPLNAASDLGLHCLLRCVCSKLCDFGMSPNNKGPDETDGVWKSRFGSPADQGPCQRMLWNYFLMT